jgi:hypothetical protein
VHASVGTPQGFYPDMAKATPRGLREARILMRRTKRAARRFTFRRARRKGFRFTSGHRPRGAKVFHLRKDALDHDGHQMDPNRPESLVFYQAATGRKVLVAFMYRAETQRFPRVTRGLLGWHRHGTTNRALPMTHIWLTDDLRSATANCLPVKEIEKARHFRYTGNQGGASGLESLPCRPPDERPPSSR